MKYTFREGNRVSGVGAQTAGSELDRIHQKHGAIKPKTVVDEARPNDALLHPVFEWNDAVAAEEWRVHTARNLIRSVQVVNAEKQTEPVYVSVQSQNNEREYQPMSAVVNHVNLYASAVYEAQCRIKAAEKALNDLKNVAERENKDDSRLAPINVAMKALATASDAVNKTH